MTTPVYTSQHAHDDGPDPFVRATYRIFGAYMASIVIIGIGSYTLIPQSWAIPICIADGLIWVLCGWFGWRQPIGLVLPLFSVITGLAVGKVAYYQPELFAISSVLSIAGFVGLTLYVHVTKKDFSFLAGFLWVAFFVLLTGIFTRPLLAHVSGALVALSIFGVLTFCAWILYDTSKILQQDETGFTPGVAALDLLLDIVGLRSWLHDLLDHVRN